MALQTWLVALLDLKSSHGWAVKISGMSSSYGDDLKSVGESLILAAAYRFDRIG